MTQSHIPSPGPSVPGDSPSGPGTDVSPWTPAAGPSTIDDTTVPVPPVSPSTAGDRPGDSPSQSPVPSGAGPSNAGTAPSPSGTGQSRSLTRRGTGPRRRPAGPGPSGRKIAGSRLIPGTTVPVPRGKIAVAMAIVSIALTLVIAAPTLLSSQDLYSWAQDAHGLGLKGAWPIFVPVSLDLAAIVCIGMTIVAAWRRERASVFALLVWVFAGVSAYAQYQHGNNARQAGGAQDAWWAFPALALLGPLLLEVTLHTMRKWARKDAGESVPLLRWIVSPIRSFGAWKWALRENLTPAEAWVFKRDMKLLRTMKDRPVEAVIHAANALQSLDQYLLRQWLAARGTIVSQSDLDEGIDLVPTDLWDTGDGDDPSVPVPAAAPVPPAAVPRPSGSPSPAGTGPTVRGGTAGPSAGTDAGGAGKVPPGTESPGTGGTEGTEKITGTRKVISAVDGTDLGPFYEQHRERLITVRANLAGWQTMPDRELTTEAIKTAGGFRKQGFACEIRKVLIHERRTLSAATN